MDVRLVLALFRILEGKDLTTIVAGIIIDGLQLDSVPLYPIGIADVIQMPLNLSRILGRE